MHHCFAFSPHTEELNRSQKKLKLNHLDYIKIKVNFYQIPDKVSKPQRNDKNESEKLAYLRTILLNTFLTHKNVRTDENKKATSKPAINK